MDKRTKTEKELREEEKLLEGSEKVGSASRARNRTVMLTPDLAGNIRARLMESDSQGQEPSKDKDAGFMSPLNRSGSGAENLRDSTRMIKREDISSYEKPVESAKDGRGTAKFSTRDFQKELSKESYPQEDLDQQEELAQTYRAPVFEARTQSVVSNSAVVEKSTSREIEAPQKPILKSEKKKLVGFLVDYQDDPNGEIVELRAGRWLVTSRSSDQGDCILINHQTVSPLHAILRVSDKGTIQVLDQLSEFGTGITREGSVEEEEIAGTMANVSHGDKIRFGEKTYIVCLVPASN